MAAPSDHVSAPSAHFRAARSFNIRVSVKYSRRGVHARLRFIHSFARFTTTIPPPLNSRNRPSITDVFGWTSVSAECNINESYDVRGRANQFYNRLVCQSIGSMRSRFKQSDSNRDRVEVDRETTINRRIWRSFHCFVRLILYQRVFFRMYIEIIKTLNCTTFNSNFKL